VDAQRFGELFERLVAVPVAAVGFERWGKGLRWESEGLRVAVLRTELRNIWPFAFTLVVGHAFLRDFDERCPAPWSRNPSEYPIKARPSEIAQLVRKFRYEPWNLGRYPQDEMSDRKAESQLERMGEELVRWVPVMPERLTPLVVLEGIRIRGEGAWCEQRWVEDYAAHLEAA
jgi:hypothetical protein